MASRPEPGRPKSGRPFQSLRRHGDFSRAYRTGRRHRQGGVTVISVPGSPGLPRVGFVAGKRVGSAVARNRAKRRLREAASRCVLKSDTVYVVVADSPVLKADFEDLVGWVAAAIDKCGTEETR